LKIGHGAWTEKKKKVWQKRGKEGAYIWLPCKRGNLQGHARCVIREGRENGVITDPLEKSSRKKNERKKHGYGQQPRGLGWCQRKNVRRCGGISVKRRRTWGLGDKRGRRIGRNLPYGSGEEGVVAKGGGGIFEKNLLFEVPAGLDSWGRGSRYELTRARKVDSLPPEFGVR